MINDVERAEMMMKSNEVWRVGIRKEIHDLFDELTTEYKQDFLSEAALLNLATEILMDEQKRHRHEERLGADGYMFGAMNN